MSKNQNIETYALEALEDNVIYETLDLPKYHIARPIGAKDYQEVIDQLDLDIDIKAYTPHFTCEKEFGNGINCENEATTEWLNIDEDGDGSYTMRCDDHPEDDGDYAPRTLNDWLLP